MVIVVSCYHSESVKNLGESELIIVSQCGCNHSESVMVS